MLDVLLLVALATEAVALSPGGGVVVRAVDRAQLDDVDLRSGDVLLSWAQETSDGGQILEGRITSPFDLADVETLRCPRGPVVLRGLRDGEPFEALVEPEWCSFRDLADPLLDPAERDAYRRGDAAVRAGRPLDGASEWNVLADRLPASVTRCWLQARAGAEQIKGQATAEGRSTLAKALACAEAVAPERALAVVSIEAVALRDAGRSAEAAPIFERLLGLLRRPGVDPLARLPFLSDVSDGVPTLEALPLVERYAPDSPLHVRLLTNLTALRIGPDLASAQEIMARLEAIFAARGEDHPAAVRSRNVLAQVLAHQGRLDEAEDLARRVVRWYRGREAVSEEAAAAEINLAGLLFWRGDIQASDDHLKYASFLLEKGKGRPRIRAVVTNNRAVNARAWGDLAGAAQLHAAAVATFEEQVPGSYMHAQALGAQAQNFLAAGDLPAARVGFERALALGEREGRETPFVADTLLYLGAVARSEGRLREAEPLYRRARAAIEARGVERLALAQALNGLAAVAHAQGDLPTALAFSEKAVAVAERLRDGIVSSSEARGLFASKFHGIYRDHVQWLAEARRSTEAFEALERGRARTLLALMAERDLRPKDGLPKELERERRASHAAYERAQSALADLPPSASAEDAEQKRLALVQARTRVVEAAEAIRRSSPRAAQLRYPDALGTAAIASALEPGVVLVSYSVGVDRTVAIVVSSGAAPAVRTVFLPVGEKALGAQVAAFRSAAERTVPPASFRADARALHRLLIEPFAAEIRGARRLLVSADGPLHGLPFAALRGPDGLLVESTAVQMVFSGSVYAEVASHRRKPTRPARLVAFGDPASAASGLPAARAEVASLAALFPGSRVYVGTDATEARAKALGPDADYVHFASHAVVDERLPLDSSLLLAAGGSDQNGRLQAWEIFEDLRIDADLVTLSACRGAAGGEQPGEGIIGLTRAFYHAGARTVVASLWDAGDRSSARFMGRFYRALRRGVPKADALRSAQIEAIRAGEHPVRWAGFQSYGDWR
jgi:CHAT domain-containing protein